MSGSRVIDSPDAIPLGWAGASLGMTYLNFGDAMSPVMVALVGGACGPPRGLRLRRDPNGSGGHHRPRLSRRDGPFLGHRLLALGQSLRAQGAARALRAPAAGTDMVIHATRGPISRALLSGGDTSPGVFGDPVWLLPRFYRPRIRKKWRLGVVLHLSDLADRAYEAHPPAGAAAL